MPPETLRRSPLPVRPQIHQIVLPTPWQVGPVQIYLVEGDPLTLVDTGVRTPESRAALEAALDALGHGLDDVRRVVLTHYHGDHLGQAQALRAAGADLEVCCHADEVPWVEEFSAERDENIEPTEALFREYGVPEDLLASQTARRREWARQDPLCDATRVDRVLRDGDRVAFKDFSFRVIHAPGHTPGHLLLHDEEAGIVLTGDHLMGDAVPFTDQHYLEGAPDPADPLRRRPRFRGLSLYLDGLRRLRAGRFRTLLPAHGGILDRPSRAIEDAILFYEVRVQRVERAFARLARAGAPVTAWQLWRELFPKADPIAEMRNRMYMVIGALDLLEAGGAARAVRLPGGALAFEAG
jgi:glyoxylase-like metal-dependent hydrolase (beta-lactamase superfamily II)